MRRWAACVPVLLLAFVASGCGSSPQQEKGSLPGTWRVDVERFSFPERQQLAHQEEAVLVVQNVDSKAIPNLAVTLSGFSYREDQGGQADPNRPAWIVDLPPAGAVSVYNDTYTFGELAPNRTATLRWKVTPVRAGTYRIAYRIAAGLSDKSKAVLDNGSPAASAQQSVILATPAQPKI